MAGDWIPMRVSLPDDPQVMSMAKYLNKQPRYLRWVECSSRDDCVTVGVTVCVTVCALLRFWGVACDRGKRDGDDLVLTSCDLDTVSHIAKVPHFGEAMAHVGWAIEEHEEVLRLPKFLLHNVPTSERRKDQDRERAKRYRERKRDQLAGSNGKSTPKTSRDASRDFVTLHNRTNKQSSSLVNVGDVCLEETRRQAKSICRALYGDTAELMDSTRQTIWVFAWLAAAGILSEAEVADVIASACKPRVQNRAQYLRGCLDKKLTKRRSSWDDAFAAAPVRPKPVPDEPK